MWCVVGSAPLMIFNVASYEEKFSLAFLDDCEHLLFQSSKHSLEGFHRHWWFVYCPDLSCYWFANNCWNIFSVRRKRCTAMPVSVVYKLGLCLTLVVTSFLCLVSNRCGRLSEIHSTAKKSKKKAKSTWDQNFRSNLTKSWSSFDATDDQRHLYDWLLCVGCTERKKGSRKEWGLFSLSFVQADKKPERRQPWMTPRYKEQTGHMTFSRLFFSLRSQLEGL